MIVIIIVNMITIMISPYDCNYDYNFQVVLDFLSLYALHALPHVSPYYKIVH